ncbi:MAG TPA: hypothetical protein VHC69_16180 [Polyangiaceae bacterium]|nr:hypothetical protein [Polyangiaceae bacterium]
MERRGILKTLLAGVAGAWSAQFAAPGRAAAQTKHIRLYVEMDIAPDKEREMLDLFHNQFVPEAVKHEGYIRVKMLKRRAVIQGSVPPAHNYRFELEFESEELRQKWIASDAHKRVWPPVERMMTTTTNYPVVLYDEV